MRTVDVASVKELSNIRKPPILAHTVITILSHILQIKPEKKGVYPNYEFDHWTPVARYMAKNGLIKDLINYDFKNLKTNKALTEVLKLVQ